MRGLSLVVARGGHSSSRCAGLSLLRPLFLQSTGSRRAGSVIVAHGPSCSTACGIFPDQGSNPCPLHWQADSQPLRHQGSPGRSFLTYPVLHPFYPFPGFLFFLPALITSDILCVSFVYFLSVPPDCKLHEEFTMTSSAFTRVPDTRKVPDKYLLNEWVRISSGSLGGGVFYILLLVYQSS